MATAEVTVRAPTRLAGDTNNPLGPFTTVAHWDGDTPHRPRLDAEALPSCGPCWRRRSGSPEEKVRVLSPYRRRRLRGRAAGLAARRSWPRWPPAPSPGRSSSASPGRRCSPASGTGPAPCSTSRSAATRDGKLVAIDHEGTSTASMGHSSRRTRRRCDRCCKRSTTRPTAHHGHDGRLCLPQCRRPRPAGPAQHPADRPHAGARRGRGQLRARVGCSTSSPTSWAWTRSSCGCATTPRSIRSPGCRGRARPCATATRSAPSGSAGRSATRPLAPCAMAAGSSATAWPA